ncbi:hypothetical protein P7K49_018835 [Saguinus oedipus]|uniref:Uncharacterized protein n=1 Tax=Saguinus oedipus TaxID=9490 RepID=A0ABQ9V7Q9_SAGOE|nr:hypothetical protein P7K49_018835 [Saguinus oedipus]
MKRPLSRCSQHAPEIAVTQSAATAQEGKLQLQPLRRDTPRRPGAAGDGGWDTNREEEKNTQPKRRMEELEAELREQERELKAPGGRERMKTRKTERKRPQRHLEVEANSFPELLDRKFDDPPDFRSGLPVLGTNS